MPTENATARMAQNADLFLAFNTNLTMSEQRNTAAQAMSKKVRHVVLLRAENTNPPSKTQSI